MYLTNRTDGYLGDGLRTNKAKCFLYHVWFCIRRLSFVLCFFITRYNTTQLECLYGILLIQSVYLVYIAENFPHIENVFNILELVNESLYIMTIYTLTGFVGSSGPLVLNLGQQWLLGYITVTLIVIIYVINFVYMIVVTINRIKEYCKKRKYQRAVRKILQNRLNAGMEQDYGPLETCASARKTTKVVDDEENSAVSLSRLNSGDDSPEELLPNRVSVLRQ